MPDVIVVGGGIAGLVAARRLALGGLSVTLLEAQRQLGGHVRRMSIAGIELDAAADSFSLRKNTVATLAKSIGLGGDLVTETPTPLWLYRDRGPVRMPEFQVGGIPGSPLAADTAALIGWPAAFRAQLDSLLPGTVAARSATLADLVRRRMGRRVLETLVQPVIGAGYTQEAELVSPTTAIPGVVAALLREGSLSRGARDLIAPAGGIRGGVNRLVTELVADLELLGVDIRVGVTASAIEPGRVTAGVEVLEGRVLLAAPPQGEGRGTRVTVATLVVDSGDIDDRRVVVAPGTPGVRARGLSQPSVAWPWLAERAGGRRVIRLSYRADNDVTPDVATADASTLLGVALAGHVDELVISQWSTDTPLTYARSDISVVGESVAGAGIAAVIEHAIAEADNVLDSEHA